MYLKANYNDIDSVSDNVLREAEVFEKTIKEMDELINSIRSCWTGGDSENFINNSSTYVKNLNQEVTEIRNLCSFSKKAADAYRGHDDGWMEKVRKVGVEEDEKRYIN